MEISRIGVRILHERAWGTPQTLVASLKRPDKSMSDSLHNRESSFREKLIEHMFVAELLRHSWDKAREKDAALIEVSRAEVDRGGYDLIAEYGGVLRHIQLKGSFKDSTVARQKVHVALEEKPSACVVWVVLDDDLWSLGPFYFLGGAPGEPIPALGDAVAKHVKGNAHGVKKERPNIRNVNKGAFTKLDRIEQLWRALFGSK